MHAWEQIQLTIDYIETHLNEEFKIDELAKLAALSPFYYQRLFSKLVKKPVLEYVKLRRMAKATESLLQEDKRILDIALDLGFHSHEHFSRTFKDTFGMTPNEYRAHPQTLSRMTKPELLLNYVLVDEGVPIITEGIVLEVNRHALPEGINYIGYEKKMPVQFVEGLGVESGVDPLMAHWEHFHDEKQKNRELFASDEEIGITLPCNEPGYFIYYAGGRAISNESINDFINWKQTSGNYVVCSFEAENFEALVMDALYKALQYIYNIWLPKHKLSTDMFCIERYPSHSPETTQMELWLKLVDC